MQMASFFVEDVAFVIWNWDWIDEDFESAQNPPRRAFNLFQRLHCKVIVIMMMMKYYMLVLWLLMYVLR